MQLKGSVEIHAPRELVWEHVTDPHVVSDCAPGVESLQVLVPDQKFRARVSIGFGSVKATFLSVVEWQSLQPPERAVVVAHGDGSGSAADVTSEMVLHEQPEGGTRIDWTAEVVVAGKIAGLATRMMGGVSRKLSGQYFDCMKERIEAEVKRRTGA